MNGRNDKSGSDIPYRRHIMKPISLHFIKETLNMIIPYTERSPLTTAALKEISKARYARI